MEQSSKRLDEAHAEGGLYRVGDRVVNAEGKDLGDEGVSQADSIDTEHKDKAEEARKKAEEENATKAMGGMPQVLARVLGIRDPSQANVGVTEPRAASQEEPDPKAPIGGVSAATLNADPGPTPVAVRGLSDNRPEPTESPADKLPDEKEVLAKNEERNAARAGAAAGGAKKRGGSSGAVAGEKAAGGGEGGGVAIE